MARGQALMSQSSFGEAEGCFRRALEHHPNFPEVLNNLGMSLARQGKLDDAAEGFRQALLSKPQLADAWANLAAVWMEKNDLERAAEYCRRALQCQSNHARAHYTLGAVMAKQGKMDDAAECWRCALQIAPDFCEATSSLGSLLARQGRVAEARSCYVKASELHPDELAWQLNVVSLCPAVFQDNEAIEAYRRQLEQNLQALSKVGHRLSLEGLHACDFRPPYQLMYHGHDQRPLREAYAGLIGHCFPHETPTGSAGPSRVGIVVTDRHEPIFLRSLGGVLDRMNPDQFELVLVGSERG